jgi:hypothetical protein
MPELSLGSSHPQGSWPNTRWSGVPPVTAHLLLIANALIEN